MKIKTKRLPLAEALATVKDAHKNPRRPMKVLKALERFLARGDLKATDFTYTLSDDAREALKKPCLILMNHSSFIDLEMVSHILKGIPYNIVCTFDGFVGKSALMRALGCIPTEKFVSDLRLIRDIDYALHTLGDSVLMYPEASYTFDGSTTPLPDGLGRLFRRLKVPVILIKTTGAFQRDPLYNNLQKRAVKVTADVSVLVKAEETSTLSPTDMDKRLKKAFEYDHFRWQKENGILIDEPFRADGLERILFKCPNCKCEGKLTGKGTTLRCDGCGATYELLPDGTLKNTAGETVFEFVTDWYRWEREEVKKELNADTYALDTEVEIGILRNAKALYMVGDGHLHHDRHGFSLLGCNGELTYSQAPAVNYGLYSDYFWYEIGDMICLGDMDTRYYCFPKKEGVVAKTRLAVEELFKQLRRN